MKKFLNKSALFIVPLILLFSSTVFYSKNKGDLIRVGFIREDNHYRDTFKSEFSRPLFYDLWTTHTKKNYTVLIVGDSFSAQGCFAYQNYLAESDSVSVLYCDINKYGNSIETLYSMINAGIFDSIDVRYVVLESVERDFVKRGEAINQKISFSALQKASIKKNKAKPSASFPPPEILKFPLFNLLYHFNDHAYVSDVYKVKMDSSLFSGHKEKELLFYKYDLKHIGLNNSEAAVSKLNKELNILSKIVQRKNIKLIVLPSPDKFDLYYNFIQNKEEFPKPVFFDLMKEMDKNYIYIDSKAILSDSILTKKDLYFYDDTHWSPWASQIIAKEISAIIRQKK